MASEWPYACIEAVAEKVAMGPFGSSIRVSTFVPTGVPVISGQHLHGLRVEDSEFNFVTEEHAEKLKNANVTRGDVIFTHAGNIGQVSYIPENSKYQKYVISQRQFYMRCDRAKILPEFVSYFFKTPEGKHKLLANTSSTGVPSIARPVTYLRSIKVPVPPLAVQRDIADILGKLDDKIELNRRMNRTLEKMAAAVFKSWFIDFDPVHAKAEGRDPNLPAEIADLFPDSFEESEIGPIPKGWDVKPIGDAVRCVGGATPSTKNPEFWEGGRHPFVTPKDMSSLQSPVILDSERHITDAGVEKISSKQLPIGTVILSSRAPIGYLGVAAVPVSVNQGVIAMICDGELPNLYVLQWTAANMDLIKSRAGGTTFAEISKKNFRPIAALIPSKPVLEAFMANVEPLHDRIALNVRQNRRLAGLRDTLLPKLLSGEIELPEGEAVAEAVASS